MDDMHASHPGRFNVRASKSAAGPARGRAPPAGRAGRCRATGGSRVTRPARGRWAARRGRRAARPRRTRRGRAGRGGPSPVPAARLRGRGDGAAGTAWLRCPDATRPTRPPRPRAPAAGGARRAGPRARRSDRRPFPFGSVEVELSFTFVGPARDAAEPRAGRALRPRRARARGGHGGVRKQKTFRTRHTIG